MHISQIWHVRKHREARRLMYSSAQHRLVNSTSIIILTICQIRTSQLILFPSSEWENLYFHLVLAPFSRISVKLGYRLQNRDCFQPLYPGICSQTQIQVNTHPNKKLSHQNIFVRRVKKECIDTIIGKSYVGDWFLFYLLGQNIDSVIFKVNIKFCIK